jgi:hypothetical protein
MLYTSHIGWPTAMITTLEAGGAEQADEVGGIVEHGVSV